MRGEEEVAKVGLVALVLGLVGVLLGGGVLLVSLLLPALTDGRTSWDEAMLGIIPGALLLSLSFVVAAAGLVVMIVKRAKKSPPGVNVQGDDARPA
jgi:uncharacterized membrane protein YhiD involved in acid resistance